MAIALQRSSFTSLMLAAALAVSGTLCAQIAAAQPGPGATLRVQRHGDHGRAVILTPGLEGGRWVWRQAEKQRQRNHVVYVVTSAGFDGVEAPVDGGNLFDRADAKLLQLIKRRKIDKPALAGHSLGGTRALRFAGEHTNLVPGVVMVDGLPIFPGMERASVEQGQGMAVRIQQKLATATSEQIQASWLGYTLKVGVIDPQLAARYAPMNPCSDIKVSAQDMAEDLTSDGPAGLR